MINKDRKGGEAIIKESWGVWVLALLVFPLPLMHSDLGYSAGVNYTVLSIEEVGGC